jgi:hypothetical protein
MATLIKNYPFWTHVILHRNPSIVQTDEKGELTVVVISA